MLRMIYQFIERKLEKNIIVDIMYISVLQFQDRHQYDS